ncbi:MAG: Magnesium and cobalt efflux protein CorC [Spirochaetes bacterium ADurb.Bin218]|mgnify:FL=1|jgi:CBS domain containing-hemolysin-like protein|nr:MAG: Magnesium and cobalt efflux protein CorC [Spirochaetes bacterium ADurb.Bin218]HOV08430.1 hemolysin family protein [Spirochaetota bacterium]
MTSENPDQANSIIKSILSNIKKKLGHEPGCFDTEAYNQLDTPRKDMIRGVMMLSELNAKDIMIPRVDVVAIESGIDLKSLVKLILEAGHSRMPVYEETIDNIIGILYVKDLIKFLTDPGKKFSVKKLLHEPLFIPETMPLDELLRDFKIKKLHLAIVVDEYGGVGGIVTMEDILEVIVGDINDEYDEVEKPECERIGPNTFEVDSRMLISDFNRETGLSITTEDFDTIGGFVFDLFGRVPQKDESIKFDNLTFRIKEISGTKIERLTVTISKSKKEDGTKKD